MVRLSLPFAEKRWPTGGEVTHRVKVPTFGRNCPLSEMSGSEHVGVLLRKVSERLVQNVVRVKEAPQLVGI